MSFQNIPSNPEEPNDWVALDPKTYELKDRANTLKELTDRVGKKDYLFTMNWHRPIPKQSSHEK